MIRQPLKSFLFAVLILVVTAVSGYSAARMATQAVQEPAIDFLIAAGLDADDYCGPNGKSHLHEHCPFCHKLGDVPEVRLVPRALRLALVPSHAPLPADIALAAQRGNPHRPARAPPTLA